MIQQAFQAFKKQRVLIVGDVMLDSYIWGKATRISPEAPVPVVQVVKRDRRLGGAANVALNLQALGATPLLCSVVGNDSDGDVLLQLMAEQGMPTDGMAQVGNRPTTIKHRILAGSQQLLRVDSEDDSPIDQAASDALLERVEALMPSASAIIFEDYDKGVLTPYSISRIIEMANAKGIPSIVDPKKRNFLQYKGCTLFKPNLKELKEGLGLAWDGFSLDEVKEATKLLKARMDIASTLITLSEYGVYITNYAEEALIPAHKREIADVSGAGDTVVSIATLCLAVGLPLPIVAGIANIGGGLVCEHLGVVPVNGERLLQEALKIYAS